MLVEAFELFFRRALGIIYRNQILLLNLGTSVALGINYRIPGGF